MNNIANIQENNVLEVLKGAFRITVINFNTVSYKNYLKERKDTLNGFIGYQVPRKGVEKITRNDFSIYIPNVIDVRIECKSLAVEGSLSRSVITEERLITNSMPEKKLIMLTEGNGFNSKEFIETLKNTKSEVTTLVNDMTKLVHIIKYGMKYS